MEEKKSKKITVLVLASLGLYLISAGFAYGAFKYLGRSEETEFVSPVDLDEGRGRLNLDAPKTEACPLNGGMFTRVEREIWEKRRPLGVMIENHLDSRPQSGLSSADVIYEAVAEGGITRFLAVYLCNASAEDVTLGPVRSTRTYYLDWISEYGDWPLYAHVGGANDFDGSGRTHVKARALEQITSFGWNLYNDLSAMSAGAPTFIRDYERLKNVATEHTTYSSTDKLWRLASTKRSLTQTDKEGKRWDDSFVPWQFESDESESGKVDEVEFSFWKNQSGYDVRWEYDPEGDLYKRFNGGEVHSDLNNGEQLTAKVVVVQFIKETGPVDANKHLLYQTLGEGKAVIFQHGQALSATWEKEERTGRTLFTDRQGKEIAFNPGLIWIEIVPAGNKISY